MSEDIIIVQHLDGTRLRLWFRDGSVGEIDLAEIVEFTGIFEPLNDPEFFKQVRINPEAGCIEWPNGADLDPLVLYSAVTGEPIVLSGNRLMVDV